MLSPGCENSDGNAIVASKPTQHANNLKVDGKIKMLADLTSFGAKTIAFQSLDLTTVRGRNRLRTTGALNMPGAVFGQIVGATAQRNHPMA
jgi:hypothetical protein